MTKRAVRGLDHVVVMVDGIDAAHRQYEKLGFQVQPRGFHTRLGTANHLMIFDKDYFEILGIVEDTPFNAERREWLKDGGGLANVALATDGADLAFDAFTAAGLNPDAPLLFDRAVEVAGKTEHAQFRTVRIPKTNMPVVGFFVCEHLTPQFVYRPEPLEVSIRKAKNLDAGPVVLLDHYDNCASGGTMDTMTVLSAMLDAGLEEAAAFAICDPQAVAQMREAGTGARVRLAARRQGRHAEPGARGLASRGRRQADPARRRSLPERWPDGARRAHGHGSDGGARHWRHRDCRDVATNRTLRHRRLPGSRHRPGRQALSDVEKPGPLASGARRDRARGRRVRRQRGMHFRLLRAPVPASAPPGLSARRDVAKAPRSAATWLTPGALSIYISHVSPRRESTMRKLLRTIAMAVVLVAPQAHAGMIGVQDPERERVKSMLERPELAAQLEKMGVSAADAKARVDAMTPEEVSQLAGRLDQLAAGGAISNQDLLLIIILLLLLIIIL